MPDTQNNTPSESGGQKKRRHARRGALKPGRWQVRLMISMPAALMLLSISMGLVYYLAALGLAGELERMQEIAALEGHQQIAANLRSMASDVSDTALLLIFLFSFLALLLGFGLVFSILLPLRQLTVAAATVARGRIQQRVNIRAGFELGELGRNFNSMVGYINSMIEQRDALLKQDTNVGTMTIDAEGRLATISPSGLDLLKMRSDELIGRSISEIRERHPDVAPNLFDFTHDCHIAFQAARKRNARDAATVLPDQPVEIDEAPGENRPEQVFSVRCAPLKNEMNQPDGLMFHFRDAVSLRNLSDLFTHTDQLAALGTFTFGLSHELRNPLGAIKGTVQLLEETIDQDDHNRPYLDRIVREVNRLDLLVRELYDFSRTPVDPRAARDINQLTALALDEATAGIDEDVLEARKLEVDYTENLPRCILQETRIVRAIANVISNAFEHTSPGHTISIHTHGTPSSSPGPVVVEISNTGSEIPPENIEKIFDPFFSTREKGTGLGLAIAYQSVLQNHGQLSVRSQAGGVTFRFAFHRTDYDAKKQSQNADTT